MRVLHCWAEGPRDARDIGSTCMLADQHEGPHQFTPDDRIMVRFDDGGALIVDTKEET